MRTHPDSPLPGLTPLAFALAAVFTAAPAAAPAQSAQATDPTLPEVKVTATPPKDEPKSEYRTERPQNPKYTEKLLDTPQTITVVPAKVIEEQNLMTLRDVLSTVPGITFGAGEGGGGYGDSINLRGFTGSTDITIDGVRDSAQYTRSDPFNIEQVEVINGASSAYTGAGSVGGSINLVSKVPQRTDFDRASAGLGTDGYKRVTADVNHAFADDSIAFRVNLMGHKNNAPGRDVEDFSRRGVAPSLALGLGSPTRLTLSYFHQNDDNIPQYGVPFFDGRGLEGVDRSNYYGYDDVDTQQIRTDMVTVLLEHDFGQNLRVRNLTRYGETDQFSLVDPPQGTYCLPSTGLTPTGTSCAGVPPGDYLPSGPRGNGRDTHNTLLINQTDFTIDFDTGPFKHTVLTGFAFTHESFDLTGTHEFRTTPNGATIAPYPLMAIDAPFHTWSGPRNRTLTGKSSGDLDNRAVYAFDTLKFNEQWSINFGARWEDNDGSSTTYTVANGVVTGAPAPADNRDHLLSYRLAATYKPTLDSSVYASFGNSKTPSKNSVNGACTPTSTTGTANCDAEPETARIYEVGGKWDLLDNALSLTTSLFRNTRANYKVADPGNPDNPSGQQTLDGRARVDGLTLGVAGNVTGKLAVFANYSWLDSRVLQGASNFQSDLGADFTAGGPLTQVPKHAGSLWATYDLPLRFKVGYGVTYEGEVSLNQQSATVHELSRSQDYWVHSAMVSWEVDRHVDIQFNLRNLFDRHYYTRMRNNGWATPGDARQAVLSANYSF